MKLGLGTRVGRADGGLQDPKSDADPRVLLW